MRRNTKKAKFFITLVEKYQMSPFYSFEILKEIYLYKVTDREISGLLNALKNDELLETNLKRITRSGRVQYIWKLTEKGMVEYHRLMEL